MANAGPLHRGEATQSISKSFGSIFGTNQEDEPGFAPPSPFNAQETAAMARSTNFSVDKSLKSKPLGREKDPNETAPAPTPAPEQDPEPGPSAAAAQAAVDAANQSAVNDTMDETGRTPAERGPGPGASTTGGNPGPGMAANGGDPGTGGGVGAGGSGNSGNSTGADNSGSQGSENGQGGYRKGGLVTTPGPAHKDEFVLTKRATSFLGADKLNRLMKIAESNGSDRQKWQQIAGLFMSSRMGRMMNS